MSESPHKILLLILLLLSVSTVTLAQSSKESLLQALKEANSADYVLFGHQDDLAYGIGWWDISGESDVKKLTNQFPSIVGWDAGNILEDRNLDSVHFNTIKRGIKTAYKMGIINTVSWHALNPTSLGGSWDTTKTVTHILPGGKDHESFKDKLDALADLLGNNRVWFKRIPVIFRPFHEHNGSWFWWGYGNCSEQEYIDLYRFTYDYLTITKGLDNLVFAFSPDKSKLGNDSLETKYLYGYPGDEYVDLLGLDNYWDTGHKMNLRTVSEQVQDLESVLNMLKKLGADKGKITALTETGNDQLEIPNWYTARILEPLKTIGFSGISYVLVWRNAGKEHFYIPYQGHESAADFINFAKDPSIKLSDDIGEQ